MIRKLRRVYRNFRGLPPFSSEELTSKLRSGGLKFEFANPLAVETFPLDGSQDAKFTYLTVEVLPAFTPPFWKCALMKRAGHSGGFLFSWGIQGTGFGELTIVKKDGIWKAETECMGKEFIKKVLSEWVDSIHID